MVRRVLFVTGRLAEPALRSVLADMHPDFAYDVAVMGITVAALMTTAWIARGLSVDEGTDLVVIPGLCEGDPAAVAEKVGVSVEKGPKDLREIPEYFGSAAASDEWRRTVVESTPLKRWGTPDDVAGAAVFLASPAAAFLTGQTILVGGGVVM